MSLLAHSENKNKY